MVKKLFRIGVVAPASPITPAIEADVMALAGELYGPEALDLTFHPQCFLSAGHFAGTDRERAAAFVEVANDPDVDAIWFARGGYGSVRLLPDVLTRLEPAAFEKTYLGYSDMSAILSGLRTIGVRSLAHGSMPGDIRREDGREAVARALTWLVTRDETAVEPLALKTPAMAFNLTTFSQIVGTPWQADVTGLALMFEDVSEYTFRLDRALMHVTSNPAIRKARGIAMGRFADIPENDRPFGETMEEIFKRCAALGGLDYLGPVDIGHDAANTVVPFGEALIG